MEDAQREMEQRALRNVRNLVDQIERDQKAREKTQRIVVVFVIVIAVAAVAVALTMKRAVDPGQASVDSCVSDVVARKVGEAVEAARKASPDKPYKELLKSQNDKLPAFTEEARATCAAGKR